MTSNTELTPEHIPADNLIDATKILLVRAGEKAISKKIFVYITACVFFAMGVLPWEGWLIIAGSLLGVEGVVNVAHVATSNRVSGGNTDTTASVTPPPRAV